MSNKNLLFLLIVVFLQTACTEQRTRPIDVTTPTQSSTLPTTSKNTPSERSANKNDIPASQVPVIVSKPSVSRPQIKPKSAPLSPAVLALLTESEKHNKAGDLASAGVDLERALRISPQNAEVAYQLAVVRLKQEKFRLAEDLGKKAAYLAGNDTDLKKRCWVLIAKARELQGNVQGAQEALLKANSLE